MKQVKKEKSSNKEARKELKIEKSEKKLIASTKTLLPKIKQIQMH